MHFENTRHFSEFNQKSADLYISAMEEGADVRKNELLSFDFKEIQKNPKNIMEIGAGNGYLTAYLSEKFPGSAIYATDESESMLWIAITHWAMIQRFRRLHFQSLPLLCFSACLGGTT